MHLHFGFFFPTENLHKIDHFLTLRKCGILHRPCLKGGFLLLLSVYVGMCVKLHQQNCY